MKFSKASAAIVWLVFAATALLGTLHMLAGFRLVLALLISFVSGIVHSYSLNYMQGDRLYKKYFFCLFCITVAAYVMAVTDNIWGLAASWSAANFFLVVLMIHKSEWRASRQAGLFAGINLGLSSLFLMTAALLLSVICKTVSIQEICVTTASVDRAALNAALGLIVSAALIQSAQWPFHRWLLSSLNSPTPVSAFMHAGLINGGGILLVIFSPLFSSSPGWLMFIFAAGGITAVMATYFKLVQTSIKRTLACSTMGQMGFMLMEVGLGFYSAALVHLCWHGLYKGYLFLGSGSALTGKRNQWENRPLKITEFTAICLIGVLGSLVFAYVSHKSPAFHNTFLILVGFAFMATSQAAYGFWGERFNFKSVCRTVTASLSVGFIYGFSIHSLTAVIGESAADTPLPLHVLHFVFLGVFLLAWALKCLDPECGIIPAKIRNRSYVWALNASQPISSAMTPERKRYAY